MTIRDSDKIWNRAVLPGPSDNLAEGDRFLSALLRAHGLCMNGGVLNAVEVMSKEDFDRALAGYRYFTLEAIAELLLKAKSSLSNDADLESLEASLDLEYFAIVPDDSFLVAVFERRLADFPSDFAPI